MCSSDLIVAETEIGTKVDVELFRQGRSKTVTIILGELEKAEVSGLINGAKKDASIDKRSFGSLGFSIEVLTPKLARDLGLDAAKEGVVVTEVVAGSPAAEKGLQVGDILRRYGQRPVSDIASLAKDIESAEKSGRSGVLILIERDGRERFVQISFSKKDGD